LWGNATQPHDIKTQSFFVLSRFSSHGYGFHAGSHVSQHGFTLGYAFQHWAFDLLIRFVHMFYYTGRGKGWWMFVPLQKWEGSVRMLSIISLDCTVA
jgi:hypothetical protein